MSASLAIEGARAWVFGDDVDTDLLAPSAYLREPPGIVAAHCLEALAPEFAAAVQPGDAFVAGRNLGIGSSREQAAEALKARAPRTGETGRVQVPASRAYPTRTSETTLLLTWGGAPYMDLP